MKNALAAALLIVRHLHKKARILKIMKRKPHSTSLVLLLMCIFTFWWGISVLAQRDLAATPAAALATPMPVAPMMVTESVSGTTYTFSGTYTLSACSSFGSGIRYSAADRGHATILLITEPSIANCAQAGGPLQEQPFTVSIKVSGEAPAFDGVEVNGSVIPSQLVTQS